MKQFKSFAEFFDFFKWQNLELLTPYNVADSYIADQFRYRTIQSMFSKMITKLHEGLNAKDQILFKMIGREMLVKKINAYVFQSKYHLNDGIDSTFAAVESKLKELFYEMQRPVIEQELVKHLTINVKDEKYLKEYKAKYPEESKISFIPRYVRILEITNGVLKLDAHSKYSIEEFKTYYNLPDVVEAKKETTNFMYISGQEGIDKIKEILDLNKSQYIEIIK